MVLYLDCVCQNRLYIQCTIIHLQMISKQSCIGTWNKILNHTFLIEISTNALPIDKFIFYLKQDHIFLIEFCSFLQAVKQKTHDVHLAHWFDNPMVHYN